MANPARKARERIQQQWPGATVARRWRNGIDLVHPDNPQRHALEATIEPIHYGAGQDLEIDTAWLPSADPAFQWAMVENDYHAHSRDVFNAGNLIRYTHADSGLWVQFDPQSLNWRNQDNAQHQIAIKQAVAAVVDDDVLRWPAAWGAGRHFQFQCQTGRLQKLLTIDSAADLPAPTVTGDIALELEYSLSIASGLSFWIDGVEWTRANGVRVTTGNHIECRNAQGETLFWLASPHAWDSDGNETAGLLQVRRDGGPNALFVNVRIPRAWIEAAQFPIYVDPTVNADVSAGADDGAVSSPSSYSATLARYVRLGWWVSPTAYWEQWHRFISMPTGLSGATIDVAYCNFFQDGGVGTANLEIHAERANAPTAPTTYADYYSRTLTTASTNWTKGSANTRVNTPSIVSVIQELADNHTISAIQIFILSNIKTGETTQAIQTRMYEDAPSSAAQLYIEYTEGGATVTQTAVRAYVDGDVATGAALANENTAATTQVGNVFFARMQLDTTGTLGAGAVGVKVRKATSVAQIPELADWTLQGVAVAAGSGIYPWGAENEWDFLLWASPPGSMLKVGSTYHLYYCGAPSYDEVGDTPEFRAIGLATSSDGVSWTKHASNPIIEYTTTAGAVSEEGATNPVVFHDGTTWHMWYAASRSIGGTEVDVDIRYRTSTDGITWTGDALVFDRNSGGSLEESIPVDVLKVGSTYYLYFLGNLVSGRGPLRIISGTDPAVLSSMSQILAGEFWGGASYLTDLDSGNRLLGLLSNPGATLHFYKINTATPSTVSALQDSYVFTDYGGYSTMLDGSTWRIIHQSSTSAYDYALVLRTAPVSTSLEWGAWFTPTVGGS